MLSAWRPAPSVPRVTTDFHVAKLRGHLFFSRWLFLYTWADCFLLLHTLSPFLGLCDDGSFCPPVHLALPWISVLSPLSSNVLSLSDLVHPVDVDAVYSLTTPTLIFTVQALPRSSMYSFIQPPSWHLLFHVPRPATFKVVEVEFLFLLLPHVLTTNQWKLSLPVSSILINEWHSLLKEKMWWSSLFLLLPKPHPVL